jgi:putative flippase GtrA
MIAARFLLVYLLTAIIDYSAFFVVLRMTGNNVLLSQIAGRVFSIPFNYFAVRSRVFESQVAHESAGPKFLLLYASGFFAAWGLIELLQGSIPLQSQEHRVLVAKMIAEGGILIVKFFVQRFFIFHGKPLQSKPN